MNAAEKQGTVLLVVVAATLVVLLGVIDYLTGYELSFALFYLIPVSLVAWGAGRNFGLGISAASAVTWMVADIASGQVYSIPAIHAWNTLLRFASFVIVTLLLSALRNTLRGEQAAARIDYVTGAMNVRHFHEHAQAEIDRSQRYNHPFTLVYVDLDNFKEVNNRFGHSVGDEVLRGVGGALRRHARGTDTVGRLGGDEFALLLPETGAKTAQVVVTKIRAGLTAEMQAHGWPVTFSMGAVTYLGAPSGVNDMIQRADRLMYAVKADNKNAVRYAVYRADEP